MGGANDDKEVTEARAHIEEVIKAERKTVEAMVDDVSKWLDAEKYEPINRADVRRNWLENHEQQHQNELMKLRDQKRFKVMNNQVFMKNAEERTQKYKKEAEQLNLKTAPLYDDVMNLSVLENELSDALRQMKLNPETILLKSTPKEAI